MSACLAYLPESIERGILEPEQDILHAFELALPIRPEYISCFEITVSEYNRIVSDDDKSKVHKHGLPSSDTCEYGIPIHYKLSVKSELAARGLVDLLVNAL